MHLADEMLDHFLRHLEIRNHAVAHRADRLDIAGGAPQHHLGVVADGTNLFLSSAIDRGDDRRLVENDAAPLDVHQGVRGAEVDRHIARQCAEKTAEHVNLPFLFFPMALRPRRFQAPAQSPGLEAAITARL